MAGMPIIGICGGIGAGKSAVTRGFELLGAQVIDADQIAHAVLRLPKILEALRKKFGDKIVSDDGLVDRARLGGIVFGTGEEAGAARRDLESVIHPAVLERIQADLKAARGRVPPPPAVVLDVPLLLEGPLDAECTHRLFVDAPEATRHARTASTRGWTADEHRRREAAQLPLDVKRSRCDAVIDNSEGEEKLLAQCRHWLNLWTKS